MGIKRGVSLYSYQQSDFFRKMTWKDMLREVATNLGGATGIEIISEATVETYPFPSERFIFDWNNEMARWGLKAVTMDTYLDTRQFRDHVMTHAEAAEHIKYDLRIASKMGFENMRLVHNVPFESIEMALPLAEKLNVRITNEIHAPAGIKPTMDCSFEESADFGYRAAADIAFAKRMNTKFYGLQPDFGIFQRRPSRVWVESFLRGSMEADKSAAVTTELIEKWDELSKPEFDEYVAKNYKHLMEHMFYNFIFSEACAKPEDLLDVAPYIYCVHGKFYEMTEIEGTTGQYEERAIAYEDAITILKAAGYEGYINSEYEGQRSQQDMGDAGLANEVEEVRRHHEMLKRLIGE